MNKKRKKNTRIRENCFAIVSFILVISTLSFSVYCFDRSKNTDKTDSFFTPVLAIGNADVNETATIVEENKVKTVKSISEPTAKPQPKIINKISENDKLLLAKTICGETGLLKSISDTERRWIVWTILNRVRSNYSTFSCQDTIFKVVTRKNQFTPMNSNGELIKQVDREIFEENKQYFLSIVEKCKYMESETNSLYYCNYKIIDSNNKQWFDTLTKQSTPGGFVHSFYTP